MANRIELEATGVPVGLIEGAVRACRAAAFARRQAGDLHGRRHRGPGRARRILREEAPLRPGARPRHRVLAALHDAIQGAVREFTEGAPQSDDITLVVLDFRG
jgi:hypothetical protein